MSQLASFHPRRHPRSSCVMTVLAQTAQGLIRGVCRNVSRGGAFITGVPWAPGEHLRLQLEVPGLGEVQAEGEVLYHHQHPDGAGVGVVFTRISDDDQSVLDRFIDLFCRPR